MTKRNKKKSVKNFFKFIKRRCPKMCAVGKWISATIVNNDRGLAVYANNHKVL